VPDPDGISHLVQQAPLPGPSINEHQRGHRRRYDEADSICQVSFFVPG
jgi:hypothetical protein